MTSEDESDERIGDDAVLWRRIPGVHVVDNDSRPSSAAFDPHPDDQQTSVCVAAVAASPDEIMMGHDGFGLVSFTAGEARRLGFTITPTEGDYPGHADLGWAGTASSRKKAQKKLATLCAERWVVKPKL